MILKRSTKTIFGTIGSAPVFAVMVSPWNAMRILKGKPPMGFVNPFLYTAYKIDPSSFLDIFAGDNACGSKGKDCCQNKFTALTGWDAVTGLGSPRFVSLAMRAISYRAPWSLTNSPTASPTTAVPTSTPSEPSTSPINKEASKMPIQLLSSRPSNAATVVTAIPFADIKQSPSIQITKYPSNIPVQTMTMTPSRKLSKKPSKIPYKIPSINPTKIPTKTPLRIPSKPPSKSPSRVPSKSPSRIPSKPPSKSPSSVPSKSPRKL
eukprot:gene2049-3995_t